jgi:hypothetical protein
MASTASTVIPKLFANAFVLVAAPMLVEAVLPLVPIKNLGDREHEQLVFPSGVGQVQNDFATEVGPDDPVFGYADNRLFSIDRRIQTFFDIQIKPALDLLLLGGDRLDDPASQGDLI